MDPSAADPAPAERLAAARELGLATAKLVAASALGNARLLEEILAERPQLARQTVSATAVLADLEGLQRWVAANADFGRSKGGVCDTEALGYVCLGRLGGNEAARVACAEFLLRQGANANATWFDDDWPDGRLPILYAAVGRNNYPALARCLLAGGANPNDGESVYHAAESGHLECLEVLLAGGADLSARDPHWNNTPLYFVAGWSPTVAQGPRARTGLVWLLEHGADPNVTASASEEVPLFQILRNGWDAGLVECFLRHGARAEARRKDGRSLFTEAVRQGRADLAALLLAHGAPDDAAPSDQFLGALSAGREEARGLLAEHPDWRTERAGEIAQVFFEAAKRGETRSIALAAELGLDVDHPLPQGERPIHGAALHGRVEVLRQLMELGADLSARDRTFHAPPLGWCVWGSGNARAEGADYAAVAELLLRAGAAQPPEAGKFGSAEVRAVFAKFRSAEGV